MKEFYTAKNHSKANKMPLFLPDGEATDHYIMVLGCDCAQARLAKNDAIRERIKGDLSPEDCKNLMIAGFIDSWSFDEECSQENKIKFLSESPYNSDKVDIFSANNGNFVKK